MKLDFQDNLFTLRCSYEERRIPKQAGFQWSPARKCWATPNGVSAHPFAGNATPAAAAALQNVQNIIELSQATTTMFYPPVPTGLELYPYQRAGVQYASMFKVCMIGDEPGLGKTMQAIALANHLGLRDLLVICPASLRLNWVREIERWTTVGHQPHAILNGKDVFGSCNVVSYDLAVNRSAEVLKLRPQMLVLDEAHYLKNPGAKRTKVVLQQIVKLADRVLLLTGTPVPNRVNELYSILRALRPDVIDHMSYGRFLTRFAKVLSGPYGDQVVGVKNERELYARLRAGFMVRRLKADVLKDLPPKSYKLVVFPADAGFIKILKREAQFDAKTIIQHGVPVGTALPEIRREMGVAMAPKAVQYVQDLFDDGVKKVVVFAHHKDVVRILQDGLAQYGVVSITGATPPGTRQAAVDCFQERADVRVFIGNIVAAGAGITLTASSDVVFAESSWVPGEDDQAADRCHRIGQQDNVLIHHLVVEGSISAAVLGAAARKRQDIQKLLD